MADNGTAAPADLRIHHGRSESTAHSPHTDSYNNHLRPRYSSLRDALRSANGGGDGVVTPIDSTSEEDYDDDSKNPVAVLLQTSKDAHSQAAKTPASAPASGSSLKVAMASEPSTPVSDMSVDGASLDDLSTLQGAKVYAVASGDKELRAILKRGVQRVGCQFAAGLAIL